MIKLTDDIVKLLLTMFIVCAIICACLVYFYGGYLLVGLVVYKLYRHAKRNK